MARPAADAKKATDPPPRIKVSNDFSWVRKPVPCMTEQECTAYAVLCALSDCSSDRFLNVRELFSLARQVCDDEAGHIAKDLVDAPTCLRVLEQLHVTHMFDGVERMQEFISIVDPCAGGLLDTAELEKAVDAVKENRPEGWPRCYGDSWVRGVVHVPLGSEARRLETEAPAREGEFKTGFGHAAFTESVLMLGLLHMHGDGVVIKASAPGGLKGLWLVGYLQSRFEELQRELQQTVVESRKRLSSYSSLSLSVQDPPGIKSPEQPSSPSRRSLASPADRRPSSPAISRQNSLFVSPSSPAFRRQSSSGVLPGGVLLPSVPEPPRPATPEPLDHGRGTIKFDWVQCAKLAYYKSNLERLLAKHPDLFAPWVDEEDPEDAPEQRFRTKPACRQCGRVRERSGFGTVFCHVCSGVDEQPLCDTMLYPVLQRDKWRRELGGLKDSDLERKPLTPIESVALGSSGQLASLASLLAAPQLKAFLPP